MESLERELHYFRTPEGTIPFLAWLEAIPDKVVRFKVRSRLTLLKAGNLGNWRSVGAGVLELKINNGPGYRVYLGQDGARLVILLCGGNKHSQRKDISDAHRYWAMYKNPDKGGVP